MGDKPEHRTSAVEREQAMLEAAQKVAAAIGPEAFIGDAHALLVAV